MFDLPAPLARENLPVLQAVAGAKGARSKSALLSAVPEIIKIQPADLSVTTPSGQTAVENQIGRTLSYVKKVGWVGNPTRGQWLFTPAGKQRLESGQCVSPKEPPSAEEHDPPTRRPGPAAGACRGSWGSWRFAAGDAVPDGNGQRIAARFTPISKK